jgi:hypothetical protein
MRFLKSLLYEAVCENHLKEQITFKSIKEAWYIFHCDSRYFDTFEAFWEPFACPSVHSVSYYITV